MSHLPVSEEATHFQRSMPSFAIIPARGGSKRIPRKNLKPFCGKPIIAYSIEAAKQSKLFDRILVTTDDDEIADVAVSLGADAAIRRPPELADDHTPTIPVIRHAIESAEKSEGVHLGFVCCIYATAPFVQPSALQEAHKLLTENPGTEFVFPATSFPFPIFRALKLNNDGTTGMFWPERELTRSQDLPEAYHDAGQFYFATRNAWMTCNRIFTAHSRAVLLPRSQVQDIDVPDDWTRAEAMFRLLSESPFSFSF